MVDLERTARGLHLKRRELLAELEEVDRAIAALEEAQAAGDVNHTADAGPEQAEVLAGPVPPIVPTVVKSRRVLADSHKHALREGRRKAREAKDAAAGRAREMPEASFVPALAPRRGIQPPRLVKKQ